MLLVSIYQESNRGCIENPSVVQLGFGQIHSSAYSSSGCKFHNSIANLY